MRVLERNGWRVSGKAGAAEILGLNRTTLLSKMKKLGIRRPTMSHL
jgi:transcriptional regulator with GAF, ATPase, and Fis domain